MNAIDYHNRLASEWDTRYLSGGFRRRLEFFCALFSAYPSNGEWLDVGCGTGTFSRELASRGLKVVGIDGAPQMIAEASRLSKSQGRSDQAMFQLCSIAGKLPFPDGMFDGCVCLSVVEYLDNPEDVIREISRVLKPGGRLIISIPNKDGILRQFSRFISRSGFLNNQKSYIDYSKIDIAPSTVRLWFREMSMEVNSMHGFDPLIPKLLHRWLKPSLLFVDLRSTCQKECS